MAREIEEQRGEIIGSQRELQGNENFGMTVSFRSK